MNIRRVNDFYTFTSKYQKMQNKNIDFYNLNYDEKIDVLYDILQEQNQKLAALYKSNEIVYPAAFKRSRMTHRAPPFIGSLISL